MFSMILLICCVLDGDAATSRSNSPSTVNGDRAGDDQAYNELVAKAGRDAEAHVRLALWCEARGMTEKRAKHLAIAVQFDPTNSLARGLLGQIEDQGEWKSAESIKKRVESDEALADKLSQYNTRRAKINEMEEARRKRIGELEANGRVLEAQAYRHVTDIKLAPEHHKLGVWCDEHGLKPEARAHFTTAVHLDPYRDIDWKRLGFIKRDGRWMSREQIEAEDDEAYAQAAADRHWEPLLKRWKTWLSDEILEKKAIKNLNAITDPRAVTSIRLVFPEKTRAVELLKIEMLKRIPGRESSRTLAALAIGSPTEEVRNQASLALKGRDPKDFAETLVNMIHSPIQYKVQPVNGPGSTGGLLIDTPRFRVLRTYDAPPAFRIASNFNGYAGLDPNGMPIVASGSDVRRFKDASTPVEQMELAILEERTAEMIAAANIKAAVAQNRLIADVQDIEQTNSSAAALNDRVVPVLQTSLEAPDLQDNEDAWKQWYFDKVGYSYQPPAKVTLVQNAVPQLPAPTFSDCFAAGTPVRTIDGPRPIESLNVGDRVLSQDVKTGALHFKPILAAHRSPPWETRRLTLNDSAPIVTCVYHRFWKTGEGWVMARDLKKGDVIRVLTGVAAVTEIVPGPALPVYNLDVADDRSFFVGVLDALVHDNTPPGSTGNNPFDAIAPPDK